MCRELGFHRTWAYQHKAKLGALLMPTAGGEAEESAADAKSRRRKPRLRFDMEVARAFWASCSLAEPAPEPKHPTQRRRQTKRRSSASERSGKPMRSVRSYKFA